MIKSLVVAIVVFLSCATAHATGHVYINPASCGPSGSWATTQATRTDVVGLFQNYVEYTFGQSGNPVLICHFFMPADNVNYSFQPIFIFNTQSPRLNANIIHMGASATAVPAYLSSIAGGPLYFNAIPFATGATGVATNVLGGGTTANLTGGASTILVQTSMPVFDEALNLPCAEDATTLCRNAMVVMMVQRLNDNAACFAAREPYSCCTGPLTGTCVTSGDYPEDVQLLGIDLTY